MKIELQRVAPADIEARSMELIDAELGEHSFTEAQLPIVKRCIHTSADFDYAKNLCFSENAVAAGLDAIQSGCTIVTDTQMARSGINKRVLERFGGQAVCFISDEDVAEEARARGITRAAVSAERAAKLPGPVILAVGNAPTALVRACELMEEGSFSPRWSLASRWDSSTWWRVRSCFCPCPGNTSPQEGARAGAISPPPSATPCSIPSPAMRGPEP